jgi:hypothetical protein
MSSFASRTAPANHWLTEAMVLIGIVVSLVLIVGSVILNFRVGYRSADTELDAWLYGCCAGAADGLKAVAPFAAYWGWKNKDWLAVVTAVCVFVAVSSYTFSAEFGFAAQHRMFKQAERSGATQRRGDLRRAFERTEARLEKMGSQRSVEEIEKAISAPTRRPWAKEAARWIRSPLAAARTGRKARTLAPRLQDWRKKRPAPGNTHALKGAAPEAGHHA